VNVTAPGPPPRALDDFAVTPLYTSVDVDVLANDLGLLNTSSLLPVEQPRNGTVLRLLPGLLRYRPALAFTGVDCLRYQVSDVYGRVVSAQLCVEVRNRPPVAVDDSVQLDMGAASSLLIDVYANDYDADDNLEYALLRIEEAPSLGSVALEYPSGSPWPQLRYTPSPLATDAVDSIRYTIVDAAGEESTAAVYIDLRAAATPPPEPVARDDSATTYEGVPVPVLVRQNDLLPQGSGAGLLTVSTPPSAGAVYEDAQGRLVYVPGAGAGPGVYQFEYTLCVGSPDPCDSAWVAVTVLPVDGASPPVARDDHAQVHGSRPTAPLCVLCNDVDSDADLDASSVRVVSPPAHGTVVVAVDGTLRYYPVGPTPPDGEDQFTYEVCDLTLLCSHALVNLTRLAAQDPVARDDSAVGASQQVITVSVLGNDDAPPGGFLLLGSVRVVEAPAHGCVLGVDPLSGTLRYQSDAGYEGADQLRYEVTADDGSVATALVHITVLANTPPVALDDAYSVPLNYSAAWPLLLEVLRNDYDAEGNLDPSSLEISVPPGEGTARVVALPGGGAAIEFTPGPDFSADTTLRYRVADSLGLWSPEAEVMLSALASSGPSTQPDAASTVENAPTALIHVLQNDAAGAEGLLLDPSSLRLYSPPAQGSVLLDLSQGAFVFEPPANTSGVFTFEYGVCDVAGVCTVETVSVTVSGAANAPPLAEDDSAQVVIGGEVRVPVLINDSDPDGNLDARSMVILAGPLYGELTVDQLTGEVHYRAPTSGGAVLERILYQVSDTAGATANATLLINVVVPASAPIARDDVASTTGSPVLVDVLANDEGMRITLGTGS
jgi:large repetitive protein